MCIYLMNAFFLMHRTNSNVFLLSFSNRVASSSSDITSFAFTSMSFFPMIALVEVTVAMVCPSPVVALERFAIFPITSFSFLVYPFSVSMALFAWYLSFFV